jgi:hypothetical protein
MSSANRDALTAEARRLEELTAQVLPAIVSLASSLTASNPFTALAGQAGLPNALREAAKALAGAPIAALAPFLDRDEGSVPDLNEVQRIAGQATEALDAARVGLAQVKEAPAGAVLPPELDAALDGLEKQLFRDIELIKERQITDKDVEQLRAAKTPEVTITAIVRDNPSAKTLDELTSELTTVISLRTDSRPDADLAAALSQLNAFTSTFSSALGALSDPATAIELSQLVTAAVATGEPNKGS